MEAILSTKVWALEASYFNQMAPLVLNRIDQGKALPEFVSKDLVKPEKGSSGIVSASLSYDWGLDLFVYSAADGSRIARIPLLGTVMKYGMCSYGTRDIAGMIARAEAEPTIKGMVMVTDGPGGAVDGTPSLGAEIRGCKKPIVGYIDGMAASAQYWLVSQTHYIVGNAYDYTQVGSIGTLAMLVDQREWLKKEGLKVEIMRAKQSTDKALLNSIEEPPVEQLAELQKELNEVTEDFIAAVKTGRGDKLQVGDENIFSGKMYDLNKALDMGMVDAAGTLQEAVDKAAEMAKTFGNAAGTTTPTTTSTASASAGDHSKSKTPIMGLFTKKAAQEQPDMKEYALGANTKALFGYSAEESPTWQLSADQVARFNAAETELAETVAAVETHSTELEGLNTQVSELQAAAKTTGEKITALEADKKALSDKLDVAPAATVTRVTKAGDPMPGDHSTQAVIDALPHNQAADAMPQIAKPTDNSQTT